MVSPLAPSDSLAPRIVIIDDQGTHLDALTMLLRREGYDCHGFSRARSALAFMSHNSVDLVIADVFMPEMDGFEFLRAVACLFPLVPVVMMSGGDRRASNDFFLDCTLRLGARAVVKKPLDFTALLSVIDRWAPRDAAAPYRLLQNDND